MGNDRAIAKTVPAGDRWFEAQSSKSNQQLATMQAPIAELIANGQEIATFGDNLRGIYLKVVGDGEVRVGDSVEVLRRSPGR